MALVYMNGFDELANPEPFWLNVGNTEFLPASPGRFGMGQCLTYGLGGGSQLLQFPFENYDPHSSNTTVTGFALKIATGGYASVLFRWYHWVGDAANYAAGWYETCRLGMDGNNILYVASPDAVIARGTHPLIPNRYYYIEWKATTAWTWRSLFPAPGSTADMVLPGVGLNEVRVDGASEIAPFNLGIGAGGCGTGAAQYVDINGSLKASAANLMVLKFNYDNFRLQTWLDDLYVVNGLGTANNDFLGDIQVQNLPVKLAGTVDPAHDQWTLGGTASPASKNAAVREVEPDYDASFVTTKHTGDLQTFRFDPIRTGLRYVSGVTLRAVMRKTDIGQRRVSFWANGWLSNQNDNPVTPSDDYEVYIQGLDTNPTDGSTWTETALNSLEAGVKLVQ